MVSCKAAYTLSTPSNPVRLRPPQFRGLHFLNHCNHRNQVPCSQTCRSSKSVDQHYHWDFPTNGASATKYSDDRQVRELPLAAIRRPLRKTRANDEAKVEALAQSIAQIGLQEPIDVLDVDGSYYGFSGCHRFEAHERLGKSTILCRVRKATKQVLKMHMM